MSKDEIIISLLREIEANLGNAGGGGSGGGLTSEGAPGNIPMISEDGKTLEDGLVSVEDLKSVLELLGSWEEETWISDYARVKTLLDIVIGTSEMPTFSSSVQYATADICVFNGKMYRFIVPHKGNWNSADVLETNFYQEFVRYYSGASTAENVVVQLNFDSTIPNFSGSYLQVTIDGAVEEYPISDTGSVVFSVLKNSTYTIKVPMFEGYSVISDRNYTSFLETRNVDVLYYSAKADITDEIVVVKTKFTNTASEFPAGEVTFINLDTSESTVYTLGDDGTCTFSVPYGVNYQLHFPSLKGFVQPLPKTFTAKLPNRTIQTAYISIVSGIMYMDENMVTYSYEDWVASGKPGTEAKYIMCTSENLTSKGGNFFFSLDDIRAAKPTNYPKKQWLSAQILVTTIPTQGGNADFGVIPYDPNTQGSGPISNQHALKSWIEDQAQEGNKYSSSMLDYIDTKTLTINGVDYDAIVGTSGQWYFLNKNNGNYAIIKAMVHELSKTDSTLPSDILWDTLTFWTSTQSSATTAWNLGGGSLDGNGSKRYSYCVLPFYAP